MKDMHSSMLQKAYDERIDGRELMGEQVKSQLLACGKDVVIHPLAKICKPGNVILHSHVTIADFVFIWGGQRTIIGRHSHVQVGAKIWGGGETFIGDYVSVGLGSVLLSALYEHKGGLRMVDHIPEGQSKTIYGELIIGNDAYIGANCTIMPVKIGEGALVGAGSVVLHDLDPWGVYVGNPCRKIGEREKVNFPNV